MESCRVGERARRSAFSGAAQNAQVENVSLRTFGQHIYIYMHLYIYIYLVVLHIGATSTRQAPSNAVFAARANKYPRRQYVKL